MEIRSPGGHQAEPLALIQSPGLHSGVVGGVVHLQTGEAAGDQEGQEFRRGGWIEPGVGQHRRSPRGQDEADRLVRGMPEAGNVGRSPLAQQFAKSAVHVLHIAPGDQGGGHVGTPGRGAPRLAGYLRFRQGITQLAQPFDHRCRSLLP